MAFNYLYTAISSTLQSYISDKNDNIMDQAFSSDRYQPSIEDVLRVKDILMSVQKSNSLPIELVDNIIDHAEYWPHSTTTTFEGQDIQVRAGNERRENCFIVRIHSR